MQTYLHILEELKEETEKTKHRSWKWMLFWQRDEKKEASSGATDSENDLLIQQNGLSHLDSPSNRHAPELFMERRGSTWSAPTKEGTVPQRLYRNILNGVRVVERDDGKFFASNFFSEH